MKIVCPNCGYENEQEGDLQDYVDERCLAICPECGEVIPAENLEEVSE